MEKLRNPFMATDTNLLGDFICDQRVIAILGCLQILSTQLVIFVSCIDVMHPLIRKQGLSNSCWERLEQAILICQGSQFMGDGQVLDLSDLISTCRVFLL